MAGAFSPCFVRLVAPWDLALLWPLSLVGSWSLFCVAVCDPLAYERLKDPRPTLNSLRGPLYAGEAFFVSGRRAGRGKGGGGGCAISCKGLRRYAPQKGTSLRRVSLSIERYYRILLNVKNCSTGKLYGWLVQYHRVSVESAFMIM